ncbi:serine hydrolase [Azorhizobium sp. AG788]|uniref:serine hydrolase n=1 Tax=Azorhizobium sp. AG788 TaxID=2183897 RepID=UPI003138A73C
MAFNRRLFLGSAAAMPLATLAASGARAADVPAGVQTGMAQFEAVTAQAGGLIRCHRGQDLQWELGKKAAEPLFVGSAVKTFILAEVLRAVEAGTLSEADQWAVNDSVRSLSSPVLINLTGTTTGRSVLEAMIAHSDNTATDIALAKAGPDNVRRLIAQAGATKTLIPHSTRRMVSYFAGAPVGKDLSWDELKKLDTGPQAGPGRPPMNDRETMISSAVDLVNWYQTALAGTYFKNPSTLTEFKRIQNMADAIAMVVPAGIAAYAKGGSIEWEGFRCFALAGQMVSGPHSVTFSFTINWSGPNETVAPIFKGYGDAVRLTLAAAIDSLKA